MARIFFGGDRLLLISIHRFTRYFFHTHETTNKQNNIRNKIKKKSKTTNETMIRVWKHIIGIIYVLWHFWVLLVGSLLFEVQVRIHKFYLYMRIYCLRVHLGKFCAVNDENSTFNIWNSNGISVVLGFNCFLCKDFSIRHEIKHKHRASKIHGTWKYKEF